MGAAGNPGATPPPPLSPLSPPPSLRDAGGRPRERRPFTLPAGPREPPPPPSPPQEGRGTRGGAPLGPYATRPHTATLPLPR